MEDAIASPASSARATPPAWTEASPRPTDVDDEVEEEDVEGDIFSSGALIAGAAFSTAFSTTTAAVPAPAPVKAAFFLRARGFSAAAFGLDVVGAGVGASTGAGAGAAVFFLRARGFSAAAFGFGAAGFVFGAEVEAAGFGFGAVALVAFVFVAAPFGTGNSNPAGADPCVPMDAFWENFSGLLLDGLSAGFGALDGFAGFFAGAFAFVAGFFTVTLFCCPYTAFSRGADFP